MWIAVLLVFIASILFASDCNAIENVKECELYIFKNIYFGHLSIHTNFYELNAVENRHSDMPLFSIYIILILKKIIV